MKKHCFFVLLVTLIALVALSGCGSDVVDSEDVDAGSETPVDEGMEYTLRIPLVLADTHPHYIAFDTVFKAEVEEKTDGKITIELYPNSQLGSDRETTEAVMLGTIEMSAPSASILPGFDERFYVLDLPYLFISAQAARSALDGDLGALLDSYLEDLGIVNLYWGESGFRNMTNNVRPITAPADLQGMKLRTMENVYHIAAFSAWGSNPTPMAFGELFTALQQGTVDGQDNATVIVSTSKFDEVQKYLSVTEHIYGGNCTFINKDLFDSMPAEYQQILRDAAKNTAVVHRQLIDEMNEELITELEDKGMEINILTAEQKKVFADASANVKEEFINQFGSELVDAAEKYNN